MKKRIAWFSPFTVKSAIAGISRDVCSELIYNYEIDIWTPTKENLFKTNCNIIKFDKTSDISALNKYDYVVYNIGNFCGFHGEIFEVMKKHNGIVIVHDQTMSNFFGQYFLFEEFGGNHISGIDPYRELVGKHYGEFGIDIFNDALKLNQFPLYAQGGMPKLNMLAPILENATAVFTHAKFFVNELKKYTNVPVGQTYLSCERKELSGTSKKRIYNYYTRDDRKIQIVSTGIVHPVKRIDKVVDVLLKNRNIAEKIQYVVVGEYGGEYGDKLYSLSQNELKGSLFMLGFQPTDVMESAIQNADLCINMRYPNSEVCSLSILEQMAFGKPTVVLNSGVFGELPNETVLRIKLEDEYNNLKSIFLNITANKEIYSIVGIRAKEFTLNNCTVKMYAENFSKFIEGLDDNVQVDVAKLSNNSISSINSVLRHFHFDENLLRQTLETLTYNISNIYNLEDIKNSDNNKVVAFWFGFQHHIPHLKREGITRFASYLALSLIKYKNVDVEVWGYSCNKETMLESFDAIVSDKLLSKKIKFFTEKDFEENFVNTEDDNLAILAREYSKADIFIPAIIYLDNVIGVDKPIFVPAHDMAVSKHYFDFITKDASYKARALDILARAENLARNGAVMFSNSKFVIGTQILKYIKNLNPNNAKQVYLPVNFVGELKILSESDLRKKIKVYGLYIFYPTQVRPYKNIQLIVESLNILKTKFPDIKLVLTGNVEDVPIVSNLVAKYNLSDYIVQLSDLSEADLYSVYKYAAVVPVTSIFEGGFPWQACEALVSDAPVAVADIPVTKERIESFGLNYNNCGVEVFDPYDAKSLTESILKIIADRQAAVKKQQVLKDKILSYTWKDAASLYYNIFFEGN